MLPLTTILRPLFARQISPAVLSTSLRTPGARCISSSSPRNAHDDLELTAGRDLMNIIEETKLETDILQAIADPSRPDSLHGLRIPREFPQSALISPNQLSRDKRMPSRPPWQKAWKLGPDAKESRRRDLFHQLDINPLKEAMNSRLLSMYVSEMGKIQNRATTQLTWKNQRRLGKAIRRAKEMGIIPKFSRRFLEDGRIVEVSSQKPRNHRT